MIVTVCNRQRLRRVDSHRLKAIAELVLRRVSAAPGQHLNIVLVTGTAMAKLNRQFHRTDGPTDILSFDYGAGMGELIISVEQALAHASRFRSTPSRELALYVIHGILHLHGYDDRAPRPRARMRAAERRLLAAIATAPGWHGIVFSV